jgi:DNA replication initiation complex subunit (GINS family)
LKIRELKIINFALALKEINLDNVIEAEKLLYENLVSSIKGYKKVKAISLYEEEELEADNLTKEREEIKSVFEESKILKKEKISKVLDSKKESDKEKIKYILVRFLKNTPPLVGVDLINYGPFAVEDIAHLPQKNAKILITEKFAEKIEIS